jgi:hypothetical protein
MGDAGARVAIVAAVLVGLSFASGGYSTAVTAGITVAAWGAVIIVLALAGRPRRPVGPAAIAVGALLTALGVLAFISLAWASDDGRAFADAVRLIGYAGIFCLVVVAAREGDGRDWLAGLALGFAVVAVVAVASRLQPSLPGGDETLMNLLPATAGRLSYPIGYWNGLGACMAVAIVALAYLGAAARTRLARTLSVAVLPVCGLAIYLASSRGAVVAAAAGLTVLLVLGPRWAVTACGLAIAAAGTAVAIAVAAGYGDLVDGLDSADAASQGDKLTILLLLVVVAVGAVRYALDGALERLRLPARSGRFLVAVGAVCLLVAAIAANPAKRLDQFNDPPANEVQARGFAASHLQSGSGNGRYQFWSVALDGFQEKPVLGLGVGGYESYWNQHASIPRSIRDAHSLFLETLAELGIVGLLLLLAAFAVALATAIVRLRSFAGDAERRAQLAAAIGVLLAVLISAAVDWTWEIPVIAIAAIVAMAVLTGPSTAATPGEDGGARRRGDAFAVGAAALVVGWLALCAGGSLLLSQLQLSDSRVAVRDGDLAAAAKDASDAAALQPWAADPRLQQALVEELDGDLPAARSRLDEAITRAPDDWRLQLLRVRLATKAGDLATARAALARARELNPRAQIFAAQPPG